MSLRVNSGVMPSSVLIENRRLAIALSAIFCSPAMAYGPRWSMRSRLNGWRYVRYVAAMYARIAVSAANPVIQMRLRKNSSGATCQLRLGITLEMARRTESVDAMAPGAWPDI